MPCGYYASAKLLRAGYDLAEISRPVDITGKNFRNVDFSQGQGAGGIPRRRSSATPHKEIPNVNAEIAEKRHSYITKRSSL